MVCFGPILAITLLIPVQTGQGVEARKLLAAQAGYYNSNAEYLVFANHPARSVANPALKKLAETKHRAWVVEAKKAMKELGKPFAAWEHEIAMHVSHQTPKLLTVGISTYSYTGGAHPNHWIEFHSFGTAMGKVRQLTLKDFFQPGFDSAQHVSKLVIQKLKSAEGADWVQSGEVKRLDAKMLQRFTPDKGGMVWFFNPYDVGPYAAGDFEVKLTLAELGPKFKRSMLD
jgi:hypothetical protein